MENEREFTDYLYNRYVEAVRNKDFDRERILRNILDNCIYVLTARKYSRLRRYVREILKTIKVAQKNGKKHKLLFSGQEGALEFEQEMEKYKQYLIKLDLSEETIRELVIERRMNYGND